MCRWNVGIAFPAIGKKIEEVPLRHECHELAARRQMSEVRERIFLVSEECANARGLLMRQLEKIVEQSELAHQFQGRRVDGVAAEVAQEVGVFFQYHHVDASSRQQEPEHQSARAAADDAAPGREPLGRHPGVRSRPCVQ
jgi:hypothetical protein